MPFLESYYVDISLQRLFLVVLMLNLIMKYLVFHISHHIALFDPHI